MSKNLEKFYKFAEENMFRHAAQEDFAWNVWQEAIASVVVELPKPEESNWGSMPYEKGLTDGMNAMLEDCQQAVIRAGIRYE